MKYERSLYDAYTGETKKWDKAFRLCYGSERDDTFPETYRHNYRDGGARIKRVQRLGRYLKRTGLMNRL